MTTEERESMAIACCAICTLSAMRDCDRCKFKVGLLYKSLQAVKTLPVEYSRFESRKYILLSMINFQNSKSV